MDDHAEIVTERLILRPLAPAHAAALYEIHANAEVMRFWHAPPHKLADETRAMIDELIAGPERVWVLCHRDGKDGIGLVYYLGNVGRPGMGYLLHPDYWGKGLMSEAVRAALEFGFVSLGLDQVELWIDARNLASQRVAGRTGFTRRAAFRHKYPHEAHPHETLVYGLRIEEWRGPGPSGRDRSRPTACSPCSLCRMCGQRRNTIATSSASKLPSSSATRQPTARYP
jgi:ribosomal-protein-alanine N-acetyltransferase